MSTRQRTNFEKIDTGISSTTAWRAPEDRRETSRLDAESRQTYPFLHHVGNVNLGGSAILFSLEGKEWVERLTGEHMPKDLSVTSSRPWERDPVSEIQDPFQIKPLEAMGLPGRQMMNLVTEKYFNSVLSRVWPLPDQVLFHETMDIAYGNQNETPSRVHTAKICVLTTWAFLSSFPDISNAIPPLERVELVNSIMASINLLQQPHVEVLESISMLVVLHLNSGNMQSSILSNTLAARFVLLLGANTRDCFRDACKFVSTGDERFRRHYHLRNLFWMCYLQDKELCLRSNQPPALSEYNCDLDLPIDHQRGCTNALPMDDCVTPVFAGDLRLSQLKSKAYCDLYSRRALEKEGTLILSEIRELDRELEEWRLSIPIGHRPTLLFSQNTSFGSNGFNIRSLMMQLEHHYCMSYIHQACGRFRLLDGTQDPEIQGIGSSLSLAIATCRSSLYCLLNVKDSLSPRDFW
ncbi:hypothetical protein N7541_005041 [Penicillium brevicompactum]|uniref:Xylanolytic transcriptional activator regulatory domain-containing protein n=1 Tax=Penicillium brevicompactum TaxID=5074 RepID=A0A9W9RI01_PENBR|nr:hypothetical protein N7541_005041 [Penicillium brevicompactum]